MTKYTACIFRFFDDYLREVHEAEEQRLLPERREEAYASIDEYFARIDKPKKPIAGLFMPHSAKLQQRIQSSIEEQRRLAQSELPKYDFRVSASKQIDNASFSEVISAFAGTYESHKEFKECSLAFLDEPIPLRIVANGNFGIINRARTNATAICHIYLPTIDEVVAKFVDSDKIAHASDVIDRLTSRTNYRKTVAEPQLDSLKQLVTTLVGGGQLYQAGKLLEMHPERNCCTEAFLEEPMLSTTAFFNRCASSHELLTRCTSQPVMAPISVPCPCPADASSPIWSDQAHLQLVHTVARRHADAAMQLSTNEQKGEDHLAHTVTLPFLNSKLAHPKCFSLPFLYQAKEFDQQTLIDEPDRFHEWITQAKSKAKYDKTNVVPKHEVDCVALFCTLNACVFRTRRYFELLTEPMSNLTNSIDRIGKQLRSVESPTMLYSADVIELKKADRTTATETANELVFITPFQRQLPETEELKSGYLMFKAYGLLVEPRSTTEFKLLDNPEDALLDKLTANKQTKKRVVEPKATTDAPPTSLSEVSPDQSTGIADSDTGFGFSIQRILKHVGARKRPIDLSSSAYACQNLQFSEIDIPIAKKPCSATAAVSNHMQLGNSATIAAVQRIEVQNKAKEARTLSGKESLSVDAGGPCRDNQLHQPAVLRDARTAPVSSVVSVASAAAGAEIVQNESTPRRTPAFCLELESVTSEETAPQNDFRRDEQVAKIPRHSNVSVGSENPRLKSMQDTNQSVKHLTVAASTGITDYRSPEKDLASADFEDDGSEIFMAAFNTPPVDPSKAKQHAENKFADGDVSDSEMESIRTPPTQRQLSTRYYSDYQQHRFAQNFTRSAADNYHQAQFDFSTQAADYSEEWPIPTKHSDRLALMRNEQMRSQEHANFVEKYPYDVNFGKLRTPLTEINRDIQAEASHSCYTATQRAMPDPLYLPRRHEPLPSTSFSCNTIDALQDEAFDSRLNWRQPFTFNTANRYASYRNAHLQEMAATSAIPGLGYSHEVTQRNSSLSIPSNFGNEQASLPSCSFHDFEMRQLNPLNQRNCDGRWESFSANDFALTPIEQMHWPNKSHKILAPNLSQSRLHQSAEQYDHESGDYHVAAFGGQINEANGFNCMGISSQDLYAQFVRDTARKSINNFGRLQDACSLPVDPYHHEIQRAPTTASNAQTFSSALESGKHDFEIENAASRTYASQGGQTTTWKGAFASQSWNDLPKIPSETTGRSVLMQSAVHATGSTTSNVNAALSGTELQKFSQEMLATLNNRANSFASLPNPNLMPELSFLKSSPPRTARQPRHPTTSSRRPFPRSATNKRQSYPSTAWRNPSRTSYKAEVSRSAIGAKRSRGIIRGFPTGTRSRLNNN